jgi:hypothetical protein
LHDKERFRVQGSRFRVQGSRFRVQGSGFRVQGSGFRVQGSGLKAKGFKGTISRQLPLRNLQTLLFMMKHLFSVPFIYDQSNH